MRFNITASGICELIGGRVIGCGETPVTGVGIVNDAVEGDVVLAENEKYFAKAAGSRASCIICEAAGDAEYNGKAVIVVEKPGEAFEKILGLFRGEEPLPEVGVGFGAVIEPGVVIGRGGRIGANCYIGRDVVLGDGCALFPNVYIGDGCRIGQNCKLYAGVGVYWGCSLGENVILHSGVVIGADGFGYRPGPKGLVKLPHAGSVEIGNDVEIGANSTIDRAKAGATVIGRGTKIDNLVHIAHNAKIGEHCVIVAQSGVAGSTRIGNGVIMAAQSGVRDHITVGDGAVIAGRAGVISDVENGLTVSGFPAREHKTEMRAEAVRMRLPEIVERIRALEREVKLLREGGEN